MNGVFAYALFGIYALTVAPVVTRFIDFGEKNIFVSIFGFTMLIAEFFALNFKLKMVRLRSEEKRIAYKKETGIDIIPSAGQAVFFGFFMRMVFHVSVIMVCMTALGYECTEEKMSTQGMIVLLIWIFADIGGCLYIYVNSGFYTDPPQNRQDMKDDLKEEDDWDKANLQLASSTSYFRMEIVSDIILQVYALMLFTSFWKYINQTGIEMLHDSLKANESAVEAGFRLFPMLFAMVILGLLPMRIAYWIEDSMEAFTTKEKLGMGITFFIAAVFTCSPAIFKFITLFILRFPADTWQAPLGYSGYLISIGLFLILLFAQILLFGKRSEK